MTTIAACGGEPEPIACAGFTPTPGLVSTPLPAGWSDEELERHDARVEREIDAVVRCKVFVGRRVEAIRDVYGDDAGDWAIERPQPSLVWGTPDDAGTGIEVELDDRDRVVAVRRWTLPSQ